MPGFMPGIHVLLKKEKRKTWMPATSAGMTEREDRASENGTE
jgi:hypothetical protein